MRANKTCPKCQSKHVMRDQVIFDHGAHEKGLRLRTDEKPDAWIFKGSLFSRILAQVCGDCGFMEMYVADPKRVWKAYKQGASG